MIEAEKIERSEVDDAHAANRGTDTKTERRSPSPDRLAATEGSDRASEQAQPTSTGAPRGRDRDHDGRGSAVSEGPNGDEQTAPSSSSGDRAESGDIAGSAAVSGGDREYGRGRSRTTGSDRRDHRNNRGDSSRRRQKRQPQMQRNKKRKRVRQGGRGEFSSSVADADLPVVGSLPEFELLQDAEALRQVAGDHASGGEDIRLNGLYEAPLTKLVEEVRAFGVDIDGAPNRHGLIDGVARRAQEMKQPLRVDGILETTDQGYGFVACEHDNYRIRPTSPFVSSFQIRQFGLKRGHPLETQVHPRRQENGESCPYVVKIRSVTGEEPEKILKLDPFEDLIPYYPLARMLLETNPDVSWDNVSMRVVDMLTPIGFGQRGLIVAPPRTGKTVLQQCIANAIALNDPDTHLIVLLIDERPEEVTDFRRQVTGEVISSTFDESAESHVHAAEMVIEKSRRMVEAGKHVIILLDSITRLARAYNAMMPSSGKILSGGVEASALQKPKRFFGSARNIEGGGSLTIIATALVDTGSRMDEVIFEEFKGTGNMELHLDRALVDKRIFPSIALEKSGTRKEELLYHPDEMSKIYSLRRAMKGVPPTEAMEMLISRVQKTRTNAEFLMTINR